ncbi:condensation domain-containing protein [Mycobacterium riyadhense]|uniref:condensation domain-containing protein n=1 Tax=Mycobacterium riyadhense TaxID=486698 RepID=UPI00195CE1D4
MWFIYKYEGPSATYNVPLAARLAGRLDSAALVAAIGDVVTRHESLRTVFAETDGVAWQQILPAHAVEVPVAMTEVCDGPELTTAVAQTRAVPIRPGHSDPDPRRSVQGVSHRTRVGVGGASHRC